MTEPRPTKAYVVGGIRHGISYFPKADYAFVKPKAAGELDFLHYHTYDEVIGFLRKWAADYPEPRRSLFGRQVLRGPGHLADHHHQQGDRQGHRQAGHVHRGQPPFRRGHGGRVRPLVRRSHPPRLRERPRADEARRYESDLRPGQEQSRRVGAIPDDGTVEPEHGPAVRRRPGQPPRRRPAGGPRRRRLHPPGPQEGRARQGHDDPWTLPIPRAG